MRYFPGIMVRKIILSLLLILTACHSPPADREKTLRISFSSPPTTVDPRKSGDFISSTLICLLYEGLTRCKGGSEIELALAERIDISDDKKTYLFHLRKSVWSDGHPVTAYDFEASWKKILQPGFPSLCSYLLYPIQNGERYAQGLASSDEVGIRALDELTLEVVLERPTPYFLSLTAFPLFLPFPAHIEENAALYSNIVCNGPFCIQQIVPNAEISLRKNPLFWQLSQIHLDNIQIAIIPDEMTALQIFERGDLDFIGGCLSPLPPDALQTLQKLQFISLAASTFCTFNVETAPFQNISLRKAFSLAIDREQIAREIIQVGQIPAERILPPNLLPPNAKPLLEAQNIEAARQYLKQATSELGLSLSDLGHLTLYYKNGQIEKRVAQALQKQWMDVLNVAIQIEQLDAKMHLHKLHERTYQIALASWISQFYDPVNILERFKSPNHPKNYAGWGSEAYVHFLERAEELENGEARLEMLSSAEELLAREAIVAPLYHWRTSTLVHPRVKGIQTTCNGGVLFERCSISTD